MLHYTISIKLGEKTSYNIVRSYPLGYMELYDIIFDYILKRTGDRGTAAWIAASVTNQLDDAAQKRLRATGALSMEA